MSSGGRLIATPLRAAAAQGPVLQPVGSGALTQPTALGVDRIWWRPDARRNPRACWQSQEMSDSALRRRQGLVMIKTEWADDLGCDLVLPLMNNHQQSTN